MIKCKIKHDLTLRCKVFKDIEFHLLGMQYKTNAIGKLILHFNLIANHSIWIINSRFMVPYSPYRIMLQGHFVVIATPAVSVLNLFLIQLNIQKVSQHAPGVQPPIFKTFLWWKNMGEPYYKLTIVVHDTNISSTVCSKIYKSHKQFTK